MPNCRSNTLQKFSQLVETTPNTVLDEWPMPDIRVYEDRTWEHTLKVAYLNSLSEKGTLMWQEAVANKNSNNLRWSMILICNYYFMCFLCT